MKKLIFLFPFFILSFGIGSISFGQTTGIHGLVKDADTGDGLAGVNIFLNKTTIGTFSDKNGRYSLRDLPSGTYTLVFSSVGFYTAKKEITIPLTFSNEINVNLKPKEYLLGEALVTGEDPRQWRRYLKRFKKWFIGISRNAKQTEILNPEVINFTNEDGVLIARASEPLEIVNKALGYKLMFFMDYFLISGNRYAVNGFTRYIELQTNDKKQLSQWRAERERAYKGSFPHFIRSLMHKKLKANGYQISFLNTKGTIGFDNVTGTQHEKVGAEVKYPQTLWSYRRLNQIRFATNRGYKYLKVKYKPEQPEYAIAIEANVNREIGQVSFLEFPEDKAIINLNSFSYEDPFVCIFNGYWAYSARAAEWLPYDYQPGAKR